MRGLVVGIVSVLVATVWAGIAYAVAHWLGGDPALFIAGGTLGLLVYVELDRETR